MPLFRKGRGPHALVLAMAGIKLGDRLLQVGCDEPPLVAALAGPTGLTGVAIAIDPRQTFLDRTTTAAASAGVLVDVRQAELGLLPFDDESFDIVVANQIVGTLTPEERVRCLQEIKRVLRRGGRCLALEAVPRGGLGGLFSRATQDSHYPGALSALAAEGFATVRVLGEREGRRFVEAVKS